MLFGTGDVAPLAERAPVMSSLDAEPLTLSCVEVLQVTYEIARREIESFLPPALQATLPPLVTWQLWRCADGPLGPFALAQTRLSSRSGTRPRAYLLGCVIDSPAAGDALTAGWGYGPRTGRVRMFRGYERIEAEVSLDGDAILELSVRNPMAIGPDDIQFVSSVHPAHTPKGLRLVQVDPELRVQRSERGHPSLGRFEAARWGEARVRPVHPLTGTYSVADLTLARLRYLARPEVNAFAGAERIG